jgi:rod shape determining protein RodA
VFSRPASRNLFFDILKEFTRGLDIWLVGATLFLIAIGMSILCWSQPTLSYFDRQVQFALAGLLLYLVFSRLPYGILTNKFSVWALYLVNLVLLLAVMVKGHSALGAQRWLAIGPITLQPSEIAKLVVIFTLAAWFGSRPIKSFADIFKAAAIILLPAILVFKQPDLGTSLTFGAIFLGMSFWAGATFLDLIILASPIISLILSAANQTWFPENKILWLTFPTLLAIVLLVFWRRHDWRKYKRTIKHIRLLLILAIILVNLAAGVARPHVWGLLKEYQQKRLTSFVNPYIDPRGSGYHIIQSLIAIGSGGVMGAGLGKGNQSQGAFIPERHTDFIFAVIGEEYGFKIAVLVIIAYTIICLRGVAAAQQSAKDPVGSNLAVGLTCLFLFHVFLNTGMTMGIMPVAGVPLPFLSYGGTALIVDLIAIAILQSIEYAHPKQIEKGLQMRS